MSAKTLWRLIFTLVVVLSVILIYSNGRTSANRFVTARNYSIQLMVALKSYKREYGKYPVLVRVPESSEVTFGDGENHNGQLISILMGTSSVTTWNPKKIVFLSLQSAWNQSSPKQGIGKDGNFYDPWGQEYRIRVAYDNKQSLTTPDGQVLDTSAIAWSIGEGDGRYFGSW
jgi:hypothetical protein